MSNNFRKIVLSKNQDKFNKQKSLFKIIQDYQPETNFDNYTYLYLYGHFSSIKKLNKYELLHLYIISNIRSVLNQIHSSFYSYNPEKHNNVFLEELSKLVLKHYNESNSQLSFEDFCLQPLDTIIPNFDRKFVNQFVKILTNKYGINSGRNLQSLLDMYKYSYSDIDSNTFFMCNSGFKYFNHHSLWLLSTPLVELPFKQSYLEKRNYGEENNKTELVAQPIAYKLFALCELLKHSTILPDGFVNPIKRFTNKKNMELMDYLVYFENIAKSFPYLKLDISYVNVENKNNSICLKLHNGKTKFSLTNNPLKKHKSNAKKMYTHNFLNFLSTGKHSFSLNCILNNNLNEKVKLQKLDDLIKFFKPNEIELINQTYDYYEKEFKNLNSSCFSIGIEVLKSIN